MILGDPFSEDHFDFRALYFMNKTVPKSGYRKRADQIIVFTRQMSVKFDLFREDNGDESVTD